MTDTAELIARLHDDARVRMALSRWFGAKPGLPEECISWEAATALAAQAQESERWKDIAGEQQTKWATRCATAEAEVKRITQMAIGDIYAEWGRRVEAAEACVRELEEKVELQTGRCEANEAANLELAQYCVKLEADRDAIEAKTIERCAEIAEKRFAAADYDEFSFQAGNDIAAAIRALRHIERDESRDGIDPADRAKIGE